jgi:hypothetical protein
MHNVIHEALVPREKILLPPLHIKPGILKQFVKALDPNSAAVHHIRKMFPHLSDAKVKGGVFTGPQICVLHLDILKKQRLLLKEMLGRPYSDIFS